MRRDEVRWICDRCGKQAMVFATSALPPSDWRTVQSPSLGDKDLCAGCVGAWFEWWNSIEEPVSA